MSSPCPPLPARSHAYTLRGRGPLRARDLGETASTASPIRPRTSWPTPEPPSTRGCNARSTGTPPSPTAAACGRWAWAWPRPWTPPSAAWGWTGRPRWSSSAARSTQRATCPAPSWPAAAAPTTSRVEDAKSIDDVIRAYEEQMAAIEKLGGKLIVMASRALASVARRPADYERVYDRVLRQAREPVILHWLGDMFDPALAGLLGQRRHRCRDGHGAGHHRGARRQGRRHQDLAARQGQGDRDAPPPAAAACACTPATTSTMPS